METRINDIDHMGSGICKNEKITFIPKTIPGDYIKYELYKCKKNYNEGRISEIITPSEDRIVEKCPYYISCGGCNISSLSYEKQLEYKKNKLINIFRKYLSLDINPEIIASPLEYGYRNKITYHNDKNLGLVSINNDVIKIDNCLLVSDKVNELYKEISNSDIRKVKEITIREVNNGLILKINGEFDYHKFIDKCIEIYVNNELVYDKEKPYINIDNIKYTITGNSFFQVNTSNIKRLYDAVITYGKFGKKDNVCDMYCGVGSISLYVARYVNKVLGIEIISDAINNAKENAIDNNILNTEFICGDVADFIDKVKDYNSVIVDPPRSGLDKHTVNVLNDIKLDKIVYVSCDPMTLARDIKLLSNYNLKDIVLVDMFPQTYHVESVVVLERIVK